MDAVANLVEERFGVMRSGSAPCWIALADVPPPEKRPGRSAVAPSGGDDPDADREMPTPDCKRLHSLGWPGLLSPTTRPTLHVLSSVSLPIASRRPSPRSAARVASRSFCGRALPCSQW